MPLSFRLTTIFYVMALLAAALTAFSMWGALAAAGVLAVWMLVLALRMAAIEGVVILLLALLLAALLLPAQMGSGPSSRNSCRVCLREIALALQSYHDTYGSFPPPHLTDASGAPTHSWRVLILPFLGEQSTYNAYSFNESWNGPNNRKLADQIPSVYQCPSTLNDSNSSCTNYFAVIGDRAAWSVDEPRSISDFVDGTSKTIQIIECRDQHVNWLEPRDYSMDEAIRELTTSDFTGHKSVWNYGLFSVYRTYSGRHISCPDGHCRYLPPTSDAELAKALLTLNGNEVADPDADFGDLDEYQTEYQFHYSRIFPTILFIALAILPAFRLNRPPAQPPARESSPW